MPIEQNNRANPSIAHMLQYFTYEHLPPHLQETSKRFTDLANWMVDNQVGSPELTAGLRKLLEAKDCAVRNALAPKKE